MTDPFVVTDGITPEALDRVYAEMALDFAGVGTWWWDMAAGTVAWSPEIEAMHGLEPGSFDGSFESFSATIHDDDRQRVLDEIAAAVAEARDLRNLYRFLRADGSTGWLRGSARLLHDPSGEAIAMVGVAIDETDVVEQREELRRQRDQLAAALGERETLATMLLRTLRPSDLPSPAEFAVDAAYLAAGVEATGDFYDLFPTSERGEWMLVIGDVAGHGPEAAVLTNSVRRSIHSAAVLASDPASVLAAANRVHLATAVDARFASVHAILLRPEPDGTIEVAIATAGHPPAIVVRSGGACERIAGTGPLLGVIADAAYTTAKTLLSPGDRLIAYTDGVIETGATSEVGPFGEERLVGWAETLAGRAGIDGAADDLLRMVAGHAEVSDDAACVVIAVPA